MKFRLGVAGGVMGLVAGAVGLVPGKAIRLRSRPEDAYAEGLKIWRKPGATDQRAACATCHGPDGVELAAYDFDDANLLRRARVHLGEEDSRAIVRFVHAVRDRNGFRQLRDPMRDRPMQPGGDVLPGETAAERDRAFGDELAQRIPELFAGRIDSLDKAHAVEKALLGLDLGKLRIGIPLNRLSEDLAHGNAHASIAQWLPEVPPSIPEKDLPTWYAAQDAYLADPSLPHLRQLIAMHERLSPRVAPDGITALAEAKYRATLVLQHRLRQGKTLGGNLSPDVSGPGTPNPIWEVGNVSRDFVLDEADQLGFGAELKRRKLGGPRIREQLADLRVSWLYLGWLLDQGLYKSTAEKPGRRGDWLAQSLWLDGPYPIHNTFSVTRRQLVISRDPAAWMGDPARRRLIWDYSALRIGQRHVSQAPQEPASRRAYLTFTANCFRMNLWLLREDLKRTGEVWVRLNSSQNVRELTSFIVMADPASRPQAERLQGELLALIAKARERQ